MDTGLFTGEQPMSDAWHAFRDFVERTEDLPIGMLVAGACARAAWTTRSSPPTTRRSPTPGVEGRRARLPADAADRTRRCRARPRASGCSRRCAATSARSSTCGPTPTRSPVQGRRAVRRRDQRGAAREDRERLALPAGGRRRADRHPDRGLARGASVDRSQRQRRLGWVQRHGCDHEVHSHERPALPTRSLLRPPPSCGARRVGGDLHRPDHADRGDRQAHQLERHPRRHRVDRGDQPAGRQASEGSERNRADRPRREVGHARQGRQREGGQGDDQVPGKPGGRHQGRQPALGQGRRRALEGQDDRLHLGHPDEGPDRPDRRRGGGGLRRHASRARDAGLEVSAGGYLGQQLSKPATESSEADRARRRR